MSADTLKLLEDRVLQAVGRLKQEAAERERLEREAREAHDLVGGLEGRLRESDRTGSGRAREVAEALREAIRELREDETASFGGPENGGREG